MSVSLSRSTSYCSHSSSPSCSPSPRRIQSPKANIPRSTANSPLPFLLAKSDKFVFLDGSVTTNTNAVSPRKLPNVSSRASSPPSSTTSTSSTSAATTPIRRSHHRGTKDGAARSIKRRQAIVPLAAGFEANDEAGPSLVTESTPLARPKTDSECERTTWTRRRGKTAEAERFDSSSSSDQDEDDKADLSSGFSPELISSERGHVPSTSETARASMSFASVLKEEEIGLSSPPLLGANRGMAAFLSSAHGLERNFETKVSMTPPARLSNDYKESPFNNNGLLAYPATDARWNSIPRSHAFGPFAPLPVEGPSSQSAKVLRRGLTFHYKSALGIDGLPNHGKEEDQSSLSILQEDDSSEERHATARSEGILRKGTRGASKTLEAKKRSATMHKSNRNPFAMDLDQDQSEDNEDAPPPSPSPAVDLTFPRRHNLSEGDSSTESEGEGSILRPGAWMAPRKMGSNRSVSTSQCQHDVSSLIGFGGEIPVRSYTTSALKNSFTSQSSLSTSCSSSKFSSQGSSTQHNKSSSSSSPYKTPNKRRARMPSSSSSSAPRSRTLSAASPVNTPIRSEKGSLFAESFHESEEVAPQFETCREAKRKSTGSFLPGNHGSGSMLFSEASPVASLSSPSRSKRLSLPPASPSIANQRKLALSKLDNSFNSPSSMGFDDSGVAFTSPALSADKLTERALGQHLGIGGYGLSINKISESPSKAALARRAVSEKQNSSAHSFSVRERSALANETRLSDGSSSVASSPDFSRRNSRVTNACSVPEGLASPNRRLGPRPTSISASNSLAVDDAMTLQAPYLTPQNYKNVIPLQTAFMSTGLASKRNRPSVGNHDVVVGEAFPPPPPKLNYALGANTSTSNTQLGLREVVAAANAHSAAQAKPAAMPDTPMKKPGFPGFATHSIAKAVPMKASKSKSRDCTNLPSMLSPPKQTSFDQNDSSSSGGESPLLNQDCDSPTLGLASVSGKHCWTGGSQQQQHQSPFRKPGLNSTQSVTSPPSRVNLYSTSPEIHLQDDEAKESQSPVLGDSNNGTSLSAFGFTRPSNIRNWSSAIMNRPASIGLQRKGSFGPPSEQGLGFSNSAVNSPVLTSDFVPTTPTRNSASIMWFEAAQLITTPSPSHRRRGGNGKRESFQRHESYQKSVSNRTSRLRLSLGAGTDSVESEKATSMGVDKVLHYESRFTVQSTLGQGEFSQVDKVEDKVDGCLYAVKRMKKPYSGPRDRLRRLEEVDILSHLSQGGGHLNIIMLVDSWEEAGSLFIQTELCPCVDFSSFLQHNSNMGGSLEEARLWKVFKELSDGLSYIHEKGVLHLDLKPANVFITEIATLKIGDFGLASRWPAVDANTILQGANMGDECNAETNSLTTKKGKNLEREGDREYIAPEIIFEARYGKAADVFSLGLILLEAAGNVILPDNGEPWQKLRNDDFSDVDLSMISTSLIKLIEACLNSNPEKRPTAQDIQNHPVLQAVSRRVALGVQVSELDQLPIFDLPSGDSSRSLASKLRSSDRSRNTSEDSQDSRNNQIIIDIEMRDDEAIDDEKRVNGMMTKIREDDSGVNRSALGLMGLDGEGDEDEKVLDIRGALIHESIDFLLAILEAEPDPSARLFHVDQADPACQQGVATAAANIVVPKINIEGGPGVLHHAPFRASPLRQHEDDDESLDRDGDIFIP